MATRLRTIGEVFHRIGVGVYLLAVLASLFSTGGRVVQAAPSTAISPTIGTGNLGTIVPPTLPSLNFCTANCVITGGTRAGTNLFHSFGQFSIGVGDVATFQNTQINGAFPLTSNILSRVTGGNISEIYGTLGTADFGNANLFLMNPAGIIFGPNATLNVGGSVTFTTANNIKLIDGQLFNAAPNPVADPLLSAAPIASFGFLGPTVAPITVYGLNVQGPMPTDDAGAPSGQKVALIGGDIKFTSDPESGAPSKVTAPGRQILITSVAGAGEVVADSLIPKAGMALGTVTLDPGTVLSTAGDPIFGDGSGGAISIRGGQFEATGARLLTSPGPSFSSGAGGDVTISVTGSATLTNSTIQTNDSFQADGSLLFAGSAGSVSITADDSLTITNSTIDSSTFLAFGDSGNVTLTTNGSLSATDSMVVTSSGISGSAGAFTATGANVTLNRVTIAADASGDPSVPTPIHSGAVTLTASNLTSGTVKVSESLISNPSFSTLLDGSPVTITGTSVNILANSTIDASMHNGTLSPANAGTIEIRGSNVNVSSSHLLSLGDGLPQSSGTGGSIRFVEAENILLTAAEVNTTATAGGGGGSIGFETKSLTVRNSTIGSETFGPGQGGSITITGAEKIVIESASIIDSSAAVTGSVQGPLGSAGPISFETQQLSIRQGSQVRAGSLPSSRGDAGNITVQGKAGTGSFSDSMTIDGAGSGIITNTQGTGAGGNITLTANEVTIQNGGTVSASTSGNTVTARGGNINIVASRSVDLNNGGSISASSTGQADAGNISINAGKIFEARNSSVTTKSEHAGGGNVAINATDRFRLVNSQVNASAFINGGNISIDPNLVVLQNSQILAQAIQGNGGNITITTPLFLADSSSLVSASSQFGLNGTVTIQSPTSNLSGSLGTLSTKPNQAQSLVTQRCAALANGQASSFVVAGREQLPADPGGWLSSPLALAGIDAERFGEGTVAEGTAHLEPRTSGLLANDRVSLRRLTPAGFLIANFADSEATGCHS